MKLFFLIFLFLLVYGCNKPKTVLICGDHICINKNEAKPIPSQPKNITNKLSPATKKSINPVNKDKYDINLP